jgi:hypothetical protein
MSLRFPKNTRNNTLDDLIRNLVPGIIEETVTNEFLNNILADGLTAVDATFEIINQADNTKVATFDSSEILTGTTRNYIFPNDSGKLMLSDNQYGCNVRFDVPINVPSDTDILIVYNTDSGGVLNNSGNNYDTTLGPYTVPVTGFYNISSRLEWAGFASRNTTELRIISSLSLILIPGTFVRIDFDRERSWAQGSVNTISSNHVFLEEGRLVFCTAFQNSGSNQFALSGTLSINFVGFE